MKTLLKWKRKKIWILFSIKSNLFLKIFLQLSLYYEDLIKNHCKDYSRVSIIKEPSLKEFLFLLATKKFKCLQKFQTLVENIAEVKKESDLFPIFPQIYSWKFSYCSDFPFFVFYWEFQALSSFLGCYQVYGFHFELLILAEQSTCTLHNVMLCIYP